MRRWPGSGRGADNATVVLRMNADGVQIDTLTRAQAEAADGEAAWLELQRHAPDLLVVDIVDPSFPGGQRIGRLTYDELLAEGDPAFDWLMR